MLVHLALASRESARSLKSSLPRGCSPPKTPGKRAAQLESAASPPPWKSTTKPHSRSSGVSLQVPASNETLASSSGYDKRKNVPASISAMRDPCTMRVVSVIIRRSLPLTKRGAPHSVNAGLIVETREREHGGSPQMRRVFVDDHLTDGTQPCSCLPYDDGCAYSIHRCRASTCRWRTQTLTRRRRNSYRR